jgi:hypothetical protein
MAYHLLCRLKSDKRLGKYWLTHPIALTSALPQEVGLPPFFIQGLLLGTFNWCQRT